MGKIKKFLRSTNVWNALIRADSGFFYWVVLIFVANPLTMFFWNLFAPQKASEFIYTWNGSGQKMKKTYCFLANLMPLNWNKFWMLYAGLKYYSPRKQAKYYLKCDTTGETLRKLDIGAVDLLFKTQKDNKVVREQIYEFRRPSDEVIISLFFSKDVNELRKFLRFSQFGKNVAETLVDLAQYEVLESKPDCHKFPLTDYLADYIRAYKMENSFLEKLRDFKGSASATEAWFSRIEPAIVAFQQRVFVREQSKNSDVRPWRNFCKSNKVIYPEAQKIMTLKQHLIFYETRHQLSPEVVLCFLQDGYPARVSMMLHWEKSKDVFQGKAKEIIENNPMLYNVYKNFINKKTKPDCYGKKKKGNSLPDRGGVEKKKPDSSGAKNFRKNKTNRSS